MSSEEQMLGFKGARPARVQLKFIKINSRTYAHIVFWIVHSSVVVSTFHILRVVQGHPVTRLLCFSIVHRDVAFYNDVWRNGILRIHRSVNRN